MKRGVFAAVLVCLLLMAFSSQAMAAYEFYMHIKGIVGDSTNTAHPGWIQVLGWGSKALPVTTNLTGSMGPGQFSVKRVANNKISPAILNLLLMNSAFDMQFDVVQAGKALHYVLGGCRATSYSISRLVSAPPMEEISFNYSTLSWSWT